MSRELTAKRFFGKRGLLAEWHPNYEFRSGQLEMAEGVERALRENRHLLVEAGTGTGKTLAYLVPAILSGKRVVVSTGTKNLQEQIFFKDIPFLEERFGRSLDACLMKGRNNFACRQKIYDAEKMPVLTGMEEVADFQIIREWEKTTATGDRAEIKTLPEDSTVWAKLDARRDLCSGSKCQQFERCFITRMQIKAQASNLIIVNHHLFFADLALKGEEFGSVIPDYEAVIFDEAHEIEDIAGQYFGLSVSNYQFYDLRRDISVLARQKNFGSEELDRILNMAEQQCEQFFELFGKNEGRQGFREHAAFLAKNERQYGDFLRAIELIGIQLSLIHDGPEEVTPLVRRTVEYGARLSEWVQEPQPSRVYWVERRGRGVYLQATPIDVSPILRDNLFGKLPAVVLTSATLAIAGSFDFAASRLGLDEPRTMLVPSPFDYQKQSLLYVPQHLPDPRSPGFTEQAALEISGILRHSRGRAFVLCTSYQQMRQLHDIVSFEIEYPTLLQGTGPRSALLDEFRNTPNCVLFATSSFWQGVDVQGEQLSCVIIDKLPFAVPSDPVVQARSQAIAERGGNAFYEYQIPQAALALKQGFGRLIRSRTDRGVLAILDPRITRQRYGQVFFDSLPDYAFTTTIVDVEAFFECTKSK